ncbi:hypothetical protein GYMLUDRAFT_244242 [Collybiopsis luxurians FD-317 M1]|uniref:Uncharacterized protein n=1 Tax=Collybiopsis luxurians FD-317 M1 TaxID=944289 RepID=A0A0D0CP94_9AGAR|nr:hypothetical protein GYMLUDRAFT_244242 [Collybiopsis luxurians FD-317 M1]
MAYPQHRKIPLFLDQIEMRTENFAMVDRSLLSAPSSPLAHTSISQSTDLHRTGTAKKSTTVRFSSMPPPQTPPKQPLTTSTRPESPLTPKPNSDAASNENEDQIPKPVSEAGRPGRGGYNLQEKLGWPAQRFKNVHGFIRTRVKATLDCSLPFSDQPLHKLQNIRDEAVVNYTFLRTYENCWVVDDLIRARLKTEKQSLKRNCDAKLAKETRAKEAQRNSLH